MIVDVRYDGHAGWYDTTFHAYGDAQGSAGLLARLLGPADPADSTYADIGCGTGLHFGAVAEKGYRAIGVDVSADQLRIAASRNPRLIRADARRLPIATASITTAVMTFVHTDVDDFPAAVAEAARVLRPGGRLIYLGVHPAYVGAFCDRRAETADREACLRAGYGDERIHRDPTGTYPMRSRVGVRYLTLATFLGAFLAQPGLRLTAVHELDTNMRPWQPEPSDGRVVPWNIAITAHAVAPAHSPRQALSS
ncbi:class I SAM-dependent methyltransferase [Rhizomonospora bruguierae]|uniref:class I SAM-dependent methyltransferase n=1 Tax=Rhizomonospora bruguierae TaxID=1581705 RepID=UPI001BD09706|nr:class I SAM-dependent methyltransferase [Micromonospora sp. NBRC 107566]